MWLVVHQEEVEPIDLAGAGRRPMMQSLSLGR